MLTNSIDYTPLRSDASFQDIDTFYINHPEIVKANQFSTHLVHIVVGTIATFCLGLLTLVLSLTARSGASWTGQAILTGTIALVFTAILIVISTIESVSRKAQAKQYIRLERFATLNNMTYVSKIIQPNHTGILFLKAVASDKRYASLPIMAGPSADVVIDVFQSKDGVQFEIGSYAAQENAGRLTLSGGAENLNPYHYICIHLNKQVPHILLDNKANNGFMQKRSNLTTVLSFSQDQVLSLEGNFNRYFTLYTPKGYEQDALYIFTPDFMSFLIDKVKDADVEFIGDRVYVYEKGYLPLTQAGLAPLFEIIDLIGTKVMTRTKNYSIATSAPETLLPILKKKSFFRIHIGQIVPGVFGVGLLLAALTVQ